MSTDTFQLIVSITLIILSTVVIGTMIVVMRAALKLGNLVKNLDGRINEFYRKASETKRKAGINMWFWLHFLRSVVSKDLVRSVFRNNKDD